MVASTPTVPSVAAHRGWHLAGAPENSIAALEAAVAGGVDAVENDVRRLADGTLVVHHDAKIGGVALSGLTREQLAQRAPGVATLDAWSRRAGQLGTFALVELKEAGYERAALDTVLRHVAPHRIATMSFEVDAVRALRELRPDLPVGLLSKDRDAMGVARRLVDPGHLARQGAALGASFLGLNVQQATSPVLAGAERLGLGVAVWTVDEPGRMRELLADPRVTTLISDRPDLARPLRDSLGAAGAAVRLLRAAATRH